MSAQVVVVGAGVVGLTAALHLAEAGVSVAVLEAEDHVDQGPEDMVYHWSTLPGLAELGVLAEARDAGLVVREWRFRALDTDDPVVFDFGVLDSEVEYPFNLHLPRSEMTRILLGRLTQNAGASVHWGTRVTEVVQDDSGVTVTATTPEGLRSFRGDWAVGADGAHSIVRRALGLGLGGFTWAERLVAIDVRFDFAELGYSDASLQLHPRFGAIVARVDRLGLWRYVFADTSQQPQRFTPDRIRHELSAVLDDRAQDLCPTAWAVHRVHERVADRFRVGRVVLVGDAAHVTTPTSSFGLACGLFDSFSLGEHIAEIAQGGAGAEVLDRWAHTRREVFRTVASPLSSDTMHLVFHIPDDAALRSEVAHYRDLVANPDRLREYLLLSRDLESNALV